MEANEIQLLPEESEAKGYHELEYEKYHEKILECIEELEKNSIEYSAALIAKKTGFSIPCINKHLKELRIHPAYKAEIDLLAIKAKQIKKAIYESALKGDKESRKMVMQMEGWKKSRKSESKSVFNNRGNIINVHGIKLTKELFDKLPKEKLELIESIIKSELNELK